MGGAAATRRKGPLEAFALALWLLCAMPISALEPEVGSYAGHGAPEPYELALRQALLGDDAYRLCQVLAVPSFSEEWAVYMVRADKPGKGYTVIARTMTRQLWSAMMRGIEKNAGTKSYSIGGQAQAAALKSIRATTRDASVSLDTSLAQRLDRVCTAVLKRTRYPADPGGGLDGTTYHAGHWVIGAFYSGQTWSPDPGTLDADFVALGEALRRFAYSTSTERKAARLQLDKATMRLERQLAPPPRQGTDTARKKT
jgi:hypothetical protein